MCVQRFHAFCFCTCNGLWVLHDRSVVPHYSFPPTTVLAQLSRAAMADTPPAARGCQHDGPLRGLGRGWM